MNFEQAELAAAVVSATSKDVLDETCLVVGYKELKRDCIDYLKVMVDYGIGGIRQYLAPLSSLDEILRESWGSPIAFPRRRSLGPAVERLDDLSFMTEIIDLHDKGANLEQYLETEPQSLNFYYRGEESDKGE
jgi:hypothetical protein